MKSLLYSAFGLVLYLSTLVLCGLTWGAFLSFTVQGDDHAVALLIPLAVVTLSFVAQTRLLLEYVRERYDAHSRDRQQSLRRHEQSKGADQSRA